MQSGDFWSDNWLIIAILVIGAAGWFVRELRSRMAQSWPVVDGAVEFTTTRVQQQGRSQREIHEVNYSYNVHGEYYSGAHQVGKESDFAAFPKLSRVVVHYKPSDPSVSFLDREDLRSRRERILAER